MNEFSRPKRPPVDRTEPNRSFARGNAGPNGGGFAEAGARGSAGDAPEPPASGAADVGYQTINNAYRLIDEYLRQGQRMAENLWLPLAGSDDDQRSPFKAPDRFMRAMSDMTMAWMEVMQQWTASAQAAPGEAPAGSSGPFTSNRRSAAADRNDVHGAPPRAYSLSVAVESRGRVQVSVEVGDPSAVTRLVPTELRAFGGDAEAIRDVRLEISAGSDVGVLRIVVPDAQPPGTYNGLLVERDTQQPRGMVSLTVL